MADDSQLKLLLMVARQVAKPAEWNELLAEATYVDLSRADLGNQNLSGFNLVGVDLSGARLYNANLSDADLSRATLTYADLRRANLAKARLNEANLMAANLSGANMVETQLEKANLQGANMAGAYLVGGSLRGARLERADLRGSNLKFTKFEGATLDDANLEDADLARAHVTRDQLTKALNVDKAILGELDDNAANARPGIKPADTHDDLFQETDCYKILEIRPDASLEDIAKAYRQKVKEYHPDRVAHLGRILQEVARREFERIQHAYRTLSQLRKEPDMEVSILVGKNKEVQVGGDFTLEHYQALSERHPNDDRICFNLGNKYFEANLLEQAAVAYRRAADANPKNEAAKHNLKIITLMTQLAKK